MGALASKRRLKEKAWQWSGPPGRHSPFPIDYVAYPGPPLLYCFIDIMTKYKIMREYSKKSVQTCYLTVFCHNCLSKLKYCA